ncbi:AbiV family abortive infection protein [Colwellia sp. C1TZA3]|uniref:AbiV family abortive infection protein n=1 Tax=Colwellia sp. C1TZA3 TaxID=2508879 RepID=UPI0011B9C42C|nr:AbiV family abortive infection protein [Colwellia sp. C1TZA3]TWX63349.1 AbiV family abortive infection protein [Colwellia sp. C1TZA3]
MKQGLSEYKFKKIASEALKNSIRLHKDSILLYKNSSYPSAFQLSVLAMEELAKAKWVEHYYTSSIYNDGFPDEKFEQDWLKLLYFHPEKQFAFVGREVTDYSPKFVEKIRSKELEQQKQQATYVGLSRKKRAIDVDSRISIPEKQISQNSAKQMISLINHELMQIHNVCEQSDGYFDIWEMNLIINEDDHPILFRWPYKSGLKSRKWNKVSRAKYS